MKANWTNDTWNTHQCDLYQDTSSAHDAVLDTQDVEGLDTLEGIEVDDIEALPWIGSKTRAALQGWDEPVLEAIGVRMPIAFDIPVGRRVPVAAKPRLQRFESTSEVRFEDYREQLVDLLAREFNGPREYVRDVVRRALPNSKGAKKSFQRLLSLAERNRLAVTQLEIITALRENWEELDLGMWKLSWKLGLRILEAFNGLPDADTVESALTELHEQWERSGSGVFAVFLKQCLRNCPDDMDFHVWVESFPDAERGSYCTVREALAA